MTSEPLWTPEDVELVAEAMAERHYDRTNPCDGCVLAAKAVLAALAEARRLVPPEAERREQWAYDCGEKPQPCYHTGPEEWAKKEAAEIYTQGSTARRVVVIGQWLPVPADPEEQPDAC